MPADNLTQSTASGSSWPALDLVKCACVAGMILVHIVCYFMTWGGVLQVPESDPFLARVRWGMVIGFMPLMIPMTAGCSFFSSLFRDQPCGRLSKTHLLRLLATSLGLVGLGYFTNVLELGWRYRSVWQILQFTGLSLLVMTLLAWRLPRLAIPMAGALALLLTPWARGEFGNSFAMYRQALFETMLPINSWPFFPWFSLVTFGFTVAWLRERQPQRFAVGLWSIGIMFSGWAWFRGNLLPPFDPAEISGYKIFNPSPDFVVGVMGVSALALALADAVARRVSLPRHGIVNAYSKGILWIYIGHLVILHRTYVWLIKHFDMRAFATDAGKWPNLAAVAAGWLAFLLLAYGIGYAAIRLLQERRIHVRLRRRPAHG